MSNNSILPHYYVLLQGFQEFLDKNLFSDVKLVFRDNQMLFLHKLVLAASSHFFKSFLNDQNEDDFVTIFLPEFDISDFR